MRERFPTIVALAGGLFIASLFVAWLLTRNLPAIGLPMVPPKTGLAEPPGKPPATAEGRSAGSERGVDLRGGPASKQLKALLQERLEQRDARAHEAVLTFASEEAYRKFLMRAAEAGLKLRGRIDALRTVQVDGMRITVRTSCSRKRRRFDAPVAIGVY